MGALFGYIGNNGETVEAILKGLARVKYLGKDGLGMATLQNGKLQRERSEKPFNQALTERDFRQLEGSMGVGEVRFATHGRPTVENTPPFFDCHKDLAVVTTGVVSNFKKQKERLSEQGHIFKSRNDGEILPHLLEDLLNGNISIEFKQLSQMLTGPYSFFLLDTTRSAIMAYSSAFPLYLSQEKGKSYLSSVPEALEAPRYELEKGKVLFLTPDTTQIVDPTTEQTTEIQIPASKELERVEVKEFENFMLQEIEQQPRALIRSLATTQEKYVDLIARMISRSEKLFLTGCGTSYNAALLGGYIFRQIANLPSSAVNAAEFRYYTLKDLEPAAVILALSQSGRTTDLLRTVRDAKMYGVSLIAILNHLATPLMDASNIYLPMGVGEENAIPATKSFMGALVCLYKIALKIAERNDLQEKVDTLESDLTNLPPIVRETIEETKPVTEQIAQKIKDKNNLFVLGRGIDLPIALEGSLKFKEAAHIHSEGMTAGELRHGPISLLKRGFPALFLVPQEKDAREDTYALISEANEAGGEAILITQKSDAKAKQASDMVITIPNVPRLLSPFVNIIPLQFLSYFLGQLRGVKVDKPNALSKSVVLE